jgi:SLT domain-containing protein
MGDQFSDLLRKMAAEIASAEIMKFLFGAGGVGSGGGQTGALIAGIGGLFGGRANGGPVNSGQPYLVGERGPEVIVPNSNGQVVSNDRMGGWGGGDVNMTVVTPDANSFRNSVRQTKRRARSLTQ